MCKLNFCCEEYLDMLPVNLRKFITRLRISAHSLRIQSGRYARNRIQRNERYCQCCSKRDIEDEYHFMLICPCYSDISKLYIKKYYSIHQCMLKFISFFILSRPLSLISSSSPQS